MDNILAISGLTKRFGSKQVLNGVTLSVPEHCVFGFVGRNGAGKTTTMKAIIGLLKPDGGEITVCGEKVSYGGTKTNRFIGYLPDVPEFYGYMTAKEYLALCGRIAGMKPAEIRQRSDELLELVGLAGEKHRIRGYSRGMKQRLGIAQALINRPKLLICDRVAFLEGGRIALSGNIEEIRRKYADTAVEVVPENPAHAALLAERFTAGEQSDGCFVFKNASAADAEALMKFLVDNHIAVSRFERKEPDLEKMFLEVISE